MSDSVTPWAVAHQASLSITNSQSLLKLMPIKLMMPSNHIILCYSLIILPSIFPSIRVFSSESGIHIRWPKYCSFSFSISPSRTDIFGDGLVGSPCSPRTQKFSPTPQFKASILQYSAFFMVQLSHPYMTTGKTTALTRWTMVGKVVSLLFNMLSQLVIAFLPRSKHPLIARQQSPSAVILEPKINK